jgi:hypothetical protein
MTAVPTLLAALHEERSARPRDVSSLRGILHPGAPIATETLRRAHVAFPAAELLHIYGTTETVPLVTMMPHEERLLDTPQARSCGQSAIGVEVAMVATDGRSVATGEVGEVAVRGPNVMVGYWNKPAQTADVPVDGWYRSGDLGYQDARGFLYLVDRAKDMIVSGGESLAAVGDGAPVRARQGSRLQPFCYPRRAAAGLPAAGPLLSAVGSCRLLIHGRFDAERRHPRRRERARGAPVGAPLAVVTALLLRLLQLEQSHQRRAVLRRHGDPVAGTRLLRRLPVVDELATARVVAEAGAAGCGDLDVVDRV